MNEPDILQPCPICGKSNGRCMKVAVGTPMEGIVCSNSKEYSNRFPNGVDPMNEPQKFKKMSRNEFEAIMFGGEPQVNNCQLCLEEHNYGICNHIPHSFLSDLIQKYRVYRSVCFWDESVGYATRDGHKACFEDFMNWLIKQEEE